MPLARAAVTRVVSSPVSRLPKLSFSSMTGCVGKAVPAVAAVDGGVAMTSWLAAAGPTVIVPVGAEVRPPPLNTSETISAV